MKITGFKDTIDWYDQNSEQYAKDLNKSLPWDSVENFVKYLPSHAYVLEVGCGPGRETKLLNEKGLRTVGIDLSEGLLKIAKRTNPNTEYIKGNFLELPFSDKEFDGVWSHASLVHLETIGEVEKALSEFFRVLKPEGVVFVKVKDQQGNSETEVVKDTLSNHERFFRYYSKTEIIELVKRAGFEIIETIEREDGHGRPEVKWIEVIGKKGI